MSASGAAPLSSGLVCAGWQPGACALARGWAGCGADSFAARRLPRRVELSKGGGGGGGMPASAFLPKASSGSVSRHESAGAACSGQQGAPPPRCARPPSPLRPPSHACLPAFPRRRRASPLPTPSPPWRPSPPSPLPALPRLPPRRRRQRPREPERRRGGRGPVRRPGHGHAAPGRIARRYCARRAGPHAHRRPPQLCLLRRRRARPKRQPRRCPAGDARPLPKRLPPPRPFCPVPAETPTSNVFSTAKEQHPTTRFPLRRPTPAPPCERS